MAKPRKRLDEDEYERFVEEALAEITERSAVIRSWAFQAAAIKPSTVPDKTVLNGLGEIAGDVERLADRVRHTVPAEALNLRLKRADTRRS